MLLLSSVAVKYNHNSCGISIVNIIYTSTKTGLSDCFQTKQCLWLPDSWQKGRHSTRRLINRSLWKGYVFLGYTVETIPSQMCLRIECQCINNIFWLHSLGNMLVFVQYVIIVLQQCGRFKKIPIWVNRIL